MTPREDLARLPRAVPWLLATFVAAIVANLAVFFGYFVVLPHAPDFDAARTTRVHLGGATYVYASSQEARIHELAQYGVFLAVPSLLGAAFLSRKVPIEPE